MTASARRPLTDPRTLLRCNRPVASPRRLAVRHNVRSQHAPVRLRGLEPIRRAQGVPTQPTLTTKLGHSKRVFSDCHNAIGSCLGEAASGLSKLDETSASRPPALAVRRSAERSVPVEALGCRCWAPPPWAARRHAEPSSLSMPSAARPFLLQKRRQIVWRSDNLL
eukprot:CAMPEP_0176103780 /NCGR_PEP_ID=MMETSP0120_2-20121206/52069_1 /TAXON_ID=160619 /ORGANISM="Kryptoperidinium foliaceum, Strain CCMP 1326" /LENGTH=165 /DNA_ID=CAMNT_0017437871 /DNA_START=8 /DNA_END=505 /DNA_ORIENTATION=-